MRIVTAVAPAWALDANGESVPTQYRIEGTTLVQVIDHHGATYPVVGDPCWSCWARTAWKLTKCTPAAAAFVAGNLFVATKLKKIGRVAEIVNRPLAAKKVDDRFETTIAITSEVARVSLIMDELG